MSNQSVNGNLRGMLRTFAVFAVVLAAASSLIYFGSRNDAVSVAQSIKAGILTADEVNVAFQNVGGRIVARDIEESQRVKKGDVLMQLDPTDNALAIAKQQAVIETQKAQLELEKASVATASSEADLSEAAAWRSIEEIEARLKASRATLKLAQKEYDRASALIKTGSVSRSVYDSAVSTLTNARSALRQTERQLASATIGADEASLKVLEEKGTAQGMPLLSVKNAREAVANRLHNIDALAASLAQSEVRLDELEVERERLTLRAPEDGKILKILYENGEMITAGAPAVLLESDRRYFDIYVNESIAPDYQAGTRVTAHAPAIGKDIQGTVRFATVSSSFADLRSTRERGQADLTSFQVRIYTDRDDAFLTGMTMEVTK